MNRKQKRRRRIRELEAGQALVVVAQEVSFFRRLARRGSPVLATPNEEAPSPVLPEGYGFCEQCNNITTHCGGVPLDGRIGPHTAVARCANRECTFAYHPWSLPCLPLGKRDNFVVFVYPKHRLLASSDRECHLSRTRVQAEYIIWQQPG